MRVSFIVEVLLVAVGVGCFYMWAMSFSPGLTVSCNNPDGCEVSGEICEEVFGVRGECFLEAWETVRVRGVRLSLGWFLAGLLCAGTGLVLALRGETGEEKKEEFKRF